VIKILTNQIKLINNLVNHHTFHNIITVVILLQAIVLALETFSEFKSYISLFEYINTLVLTIFIIEAILKMAALYPQPYKYFKDGWNILDFFIIVISLVPFTGSFTTVARLIRLLRITRLTNRSKEMSVMVMTIVKSLPSMVNIFLLLSLLFFIYGIAGYHLFNTIDSHHWGTLPKSIITLFKILTLEGWVEIMAPVTAVNPLNGIFFVSFIIIGTFIVINIFVAIIVKKSEEAYKYIQSEFPNKVTQTEILEEMKEIRKTIENLEKKISSSKE
jgi:voltage-gated sodium channel